MHSRCTCSVICIFGYFFVSLAIIFDMIKIVIEQSTDRGRTFSSLIKLNRTIMRHGWTEPHTDPRYRKQYPRVLHHITAPMICMCFTCIVTGRPARSAVMPVFHFLSDPKMGFLPRRGDTLSR